MLILARYSELAGQPVQLAVRRRDLAAARELLDDDETIGRARP